MNLQNGINQLEEDMYESNKLNIIILIPLLLVFLHCFYLCNVVGSSMEPALVENNKLLASKVNINYDIDDIIIFKFEEKFVVKRIVAKEGDLVKITGNQLYINSLPIEDCYVDYFIFYFTGIIPENAYYVLGDNKFNSCDSRYFGLVYKDDIFAKKIFNFNKDFSLFK